jgi:hypothetical protein
MPGLREQKPALATDLMALFCRLSLGLRLHQRSSCDRPATGANHRSASQRPRPESHVPIDPLLPWHRLFDMVDAEDLVVDDAVDEVKHAEAHQDRAQQQLARPSNVLVRE